MVRFAPFPRTERLAPDVLYLSIYPIFRPVHARSQRLPIYLLRLRKKAEENKNKKPNKKTEQKPKKTKKKTGKNRKNKKQKQKKTKTGCLLSWHGSECEARPSSGLALCLTMSCVYRPRSGSLPALQPASWDITTHRRHGT